MPTWLLKSEPSVFSFAELQRDKKVVWDGVTNATALKHIRSMKKGDRAFIYHTGDEKAVVGLAQITSNPYSDSKQQNEKLVVFDLVPDRLLKQHVKLARVKADKRFKDFPLVTIGRLSVMPVPPELEKALLDMAGESFTADTLRCCK